MDTRTEKITERALVSITMATYNRAAYIEKAVQSVIKQTYANWELIIVDDGSTDDTEARIQSFGDMRIKYQKHDVNQGISQTRMDALGACTGTYIAVLDSDDVWSDPEKLSKQVNFLEAHSDYAIVGTFITTIDAQGNEIGSDSYYADDAAIRSHILLRNQFAHSSILMRRNLVEKVNGYGTISLGEDLDLFLHLGAYGKFANIPEFMTLYRVHAGGATRNAVAMAQSIHSIIQRHRFHYPGYVPALLKSYLRILRATLTSR